MSIPLSLSLEKSHARNSGGFLALHPNIEAIRGIVDPEFGTIELSEPGSLIRFDLHDHLVE
jgi:hypothetical protein